MKAFGRGWWRRPGGRYAVVGGSVYGVELGVIVLAQHLGASGLVAVGLGFWVGLLLSFGLQKLVTFKDRRRQPRVVVGQLAAFALLVLFNFGFTLLLTAWLPLPAVVSRTIALGVTTLWNFYLYKTSLFQSSAPKEVLSKENYMGKL